jgi:hypothetical protein
VHKEATDHISLHSTMHRMPDRHGDRSHDPVQSLVAEYPDGDRKRTRPTSVSASSPLGESREGSGNGHVPVVFSAPSCCSYRLVRHKPQLSSARSSQRRGLRNSLVPNSFTYGRRTPCERSVLSHIRRSACPYRLDVFHPPSQVPIPQLTSTPESPVRLTLQ